MLHGITGLLECLLGYQGYQGSRNGDTSAPLPVTAAMLPLPPFYDATCRDTMQADQQGVPSLVLGLPRMRHVSSHPILPEGGKRQMDDAPGPAERVCLSVVPQPPAR
jgi:hypothetical protein